MDEIQCLSRILMAPLEGEIRKEVQLVAELFRGYALKDPPFPDVPEHRGVIAFLAPQLVGESLNFRIRLRMVLQAVRALGAGAEQ
jgi:hypothetical protein